MTFTAGAPDAQAAPIDCDLIVARSGESGLQLRVPSSVESHAFVPRSAGPGEIVRRIARVVTQTKTP